MTKADQQVLPSWKFSSIFFYLKKSKAFFGAIYLIVCASTFMTEIKTWVLKCSASKDFSLISSESL